MSRIDTLKLETIIHKDVLDSYRFTQNGVGNSTFQLQNGFKKNLQTKLLNDPQLIKELDKFSYCALEILRNGDNSHISKKDLDPLPYMKEIEILDENNSLIGTMFGACEYSLYVKPNRLNKFWPWAKRHESHWRGKNGKWYADRVVNNREFYGNQYTGKKADIKGLSAKFRYFGQISFVLGIGCSVYETTNSMLKGDTSGIIKGTMDIIIGITATYGGPVGWAIGGAYLVIGLTDSFNVNHSLKCIYKDSGICEQDKTYVAPIPLMY